MAGVAEPSSGSETERAVGRLRDWLVVILLMAALILSFVDRIGLSLLLDPIRKDLGLSDAQIGLLQGIAFGIFFAVMGVPLGWLADRWSRKGTVIAGVSVWSIATAACGLAGSFGQLLAARIFVGAGEAGLAPASYAIVRERFPERLLARAISLFQVGGVVGSGLALIVTGAVYRQLDQDAGRHIPLIADLRPWQQTLVVIALPGMLFVLLLSFIRTGRGGTASAAGPATSALRELVRGRGLYVPLFLGMSGIILTSYALVSWVPAILGREFGWTPAEVGARYGAVVLLASPIGLMAGGWLADRMVAAGVASSHVRIAAFAALIALLPAVAISLPRGPAGILLLLAVLHFAVSFPMGVIPAFVQIAAPPPLRGRISGIYIMVINVIGLGLGPTLVGALSSTLGSQPSALRDAVALVAGPAILLSVIILSRLAWRSRAEFKLPSHA